MKLRKRGFTLVELCIVIALIAVIAVMTVGFTVLMSSRTRQSQADAQTMQNVADVEIAVKKWITHYDNSDFYLAIGAAGELIMNDTAGTAATADDFEKARLYFDTESKKLICLERPSRGAEPTTYASYDLPSVTGLFFTVTPSESHQLVKCELSYRKPGTSEDAAPLTEIIIFTTHAQRIFN